MPYGCCVDCTYCRYNGMKVKRFAEERLRRLTKKYESAVTRVKELEETANKKIEEINSDESLNPGQKKYRIGRIKSDLRRATVNLKADTICDINAETVLDSIPCECRIRSCVKFVSGSEKNRVEFPTMHGGFVARRMMGCGEFEPVEDES